MTQFCSNFVPIVFYRGECASGSMWNFRGARQSDDLWTIILIYFDVHTLWLLQSRVPFTIYTINDVYILHAFDIYTCICICIYMWPHIIWLYTLCLYLYVLHIFGFCWCPISFVSNQLVSHYQLPGKFTSRRSAKALIHAGVMRLNLNHQ